MATGGGRASGRASRRFTRMVDAAAIAQARRSGADIATSVSGAASARPRFSRDIVKWVEQTRRLHGKPFSFEGRDYLLPIYREQAPEVCIVKGRQTELTELATNIVGYCGYTYPYTVTNYISDIWDNASIFSDLRMGDYAIRDSPLWREHVISPARHFAHKSKFHNGSVCYYLSSQHRYANARSKPADFLVLDEVQSHELEYLEVAKEGLSHSPHGRVWYIGTGSYEETDWYKKWHEGTQYEWDAEAGAWVVTGRGDFADIVHSYHIPQTIVPWITQEEVDRKMRQARSMNVAIMEIMGWWVKGVTKPITLNMLRQNYDKTLSLVDPADIDHDLGPVFLGFDWGGGTRAHTVAWITQLVDPDVPRFVVRSAILIDDPDVDKQADRAISIIDEASPDLGVMDQGGGTRQVQKVEDRYQDLVHKCVYHTDVLQPLNLDRLYPDNLVKANRTNSIDGVIDLLRLPELRPGKVPLPRYVIPAAPDCAKDIAWIERHFTSIYARPMRTQSGQEYIKYDKEPGDVTDGLHGATYAHIAYLVWREEQGSLPTAAVGDMA